MGDSWASLQCSPRHSRFEGPGEHIYINYGHLRKDASQATYCFRSSRSPQPGKTDPTKEESPQSSDQKYYREATQGRDRLLNAPITTISSRPKAQWFETFLNDQYKAPGNGFRRFLDVTRSECQSLNKLLMEWLESSFERNLTQLEDLKVPNGSEERRTSFTNYLKAKAEVNNERENLMRAGSRVQRSMHSTGQ